MLSDGARFDLIVIGGGINGAAIAREAALSGHSVLLLEREDFCAGTSAASTRLIHGGLRYLEHAEIALVRESLAERERLLRTAPHLVEPLEIVLPLTAQSRRGPLTIRLGMWLYDLLSAGKSLPRHRMLDRGGILDALPGLDAATLVGGAAYYDAQVRFPERLVVENVLDAGDNGATVASHTAAREIVVENGRVVGVKFDGAGGRGLARAAVVVNATGPWVDATLGTLGSRPLIGGTRGSHLIAARFTDAPSRAIYAEAASDGRPFFIIPWNGLWLIGTTDERYDGDPGDAAMTREEYDYLVTETRRLFPRATDLPASIRYTYSGIRPLPSTAGKRPGAITRRHLVRRHREVRGLYSIIGGKLTTHRSLAADCLALIAPELASKRPSPTLERPLPGCLDPHDRDALVAALTDRFDGATATRLWRTYGGLAARLLESVATRPELADRIAPVSGLRVAELVMAVEREHAHTLVDILQRRTMAGLDADFGRPLAPLAADCMVRLGYWDRLRADEEVGAYEIFGRRFAVPGQERSTGS